MRLASRIDSDEHGAATVEFALLAILLFMLIFGGISAGIAISQANALQTAAREGVRFGATLPQAQNTAELDQILNVTISAATGSLDTSDRYLCVSFRNGSSGWVTREILGSASPIDGTGPCFTDNRPANEKRIQVVVERDTSIEAIAFSTDVRLSEEAVARYER